MKATETFLIFGNGLGAEFGYYNKAKNGMNEKEQELSKRVSILADALYKKLKSFLPDEDLKLVFDVQSQNGKPLLLDLVSALFSNPRSMSKSSEFCCSFYAFSRFEKEHLAKIFKRINKDSLFGSYASISVVEKGSGFCFKLNVY